MRKKVKKASLEKNVEGLMKSVGFIAKHMATKEELSVAEKRLQGNLSDVEKRLQGNLSDVEKRLQGNLSDVEKRLHGEIVDLSESVSFIVEHMSTKEELYAVEKHLHDEIVSKTGSIEKRLDYELDKRGHLEVRVSKLEQNTR